MPTLSKPRTIATSVAVAALTLALCSSAAGIVHAAQQTISGPKSSCAFNQQRWDDSKLKLDEAISTAKNSLTQTGELHLNQTDLLSGYLFQQPHSSNYLALNNAYADAVATKDSFVRPECDGSKESKIASEHALSEIVNAVNTLARAQKSLQVNSDTYEQQRRCDALRLASRDESDVLMRIDRTMSQLRGTLTDIDQITTDIQDIRAQTAIFERDLAREQKEADAAARARDASTVATPTTTAEDRATSILKKPHTNRGGDSYTRSSTASAQSTESGSATNTSYLSRRLDSLERSAQHIDLDTPCDNLDDLRELTSNDTRDHTGAVISIADQLKNITNEINELRESTIATRDSAQHAQDQITAQREELQREKEAQLEDQRLAQEAEEEARNAIIQEREAAEAALRETQELLSRLDNTDNAVNDDASAIADSLLNN